MVGFTITPSRAAVRLNSGVRPVQRKCRSTSAKLGSVDPRLFQAFDPRHKLRAG